MTIELNHTIVHARDARASAGFLAGLLGLPDPVAFGPFQAVAVGNGVTLHYSDAGGEVAPQHYAFLVGEAEFDAIFGRIRARGVYVEDPSGHLLEIITRAYGSGR